MKITSYYKYVDYPKQEWNFEVQQLKEFNACLDLLKKRNIRTILVFAPIAPNYYNSYTNNDYVDSTFQSYNLEYYNFNKLKQLDDSLHFYDKHHLNQNVVMLFNPKRIEILNLEK